jgi:hypothetical protein
VYSTWGTILDISAGYSHVNFLYTNGVLASAGFINWGDVDWGSDCFGYAPKQTKLPKYLLYGETIVNVVGSWCQTMVQT